MTKIDLKSQLGNLVKLQVIDTNIYALKADKEAKPQEIKALEANFEGKKQKLAVLEKTSLDFQKQKKERELDLGAKEENAKKLQTQLFSLKTNKEYQAMLQQINDAKADASLIEDKILESMEQVDKIKKEVDEEKKRLQEEEGILNAQKKTVEDKMKEIDGFLAQAQAQRKQILPDIDPGVLTQYERILNSRDGLAIVGADGNSCHGCNMFVPPQVINLIKMYERIITCEVCNRILYIKNETS